MKKTLIVLGAAAMLASCTTGESVFPGRQTEINISNVITPIKIVDYETNFSKKVEGTAEGFLSKTTNLDYYKEQAIVRACAAASADFLINPTFTVNTKGSVTTVKVTGYPAKYTEIREAVPADSIHLKYSGGAAAPHKSNRIKMIY